MELHLDTDLGGDPDDACALLLLLGWPDVDIVGITTVLDPDGRRAGGVGHYLELTGRADIALAAGAGPTLSGEVHEHTVDDERYWPGPVAARPGPVDAALDLLVASIERGATVAVIGPATNLALLEQRQPGALTGARVVMMGGWTADGMGAGLPAWGPERDWNVQSDVAAAELLLGSGARLTMAPIPALTPAHLRRRDLPHLRAAGPAGALAARQSEVYGEDGDHAALAATHPALADDLVNFHWDPVTCAVAVGWPGAEEVAHRLRWWRDDGMLHLTDDPAGRPVGIVESVDADAFTETFLTVVEAAAP